MLENILRPVIPQYKSNLDKPIVTVNEGKVRGIKQKSEFSQAEYYSFFGIPYGQSTTGPGRFKDPVKVGPWKNVLDATVEKDGCLQHAYHLPYATGSEDCLYNNIHTPQLPRKVNPLKPVIVNIHPGAIIYGQPESHSYGSPDYVMHRDIVYVCIAYRLHVLGFLNLGIEECPGNVGLRDIILGLKWIRDNISAFGGDPNNVTLLGASSGGNLVHSLMLSSRCSGLFHKAIIMGLYNFSPTIIHKDNYSEQAFKIAKDFGYNGSEEGDKKGLLRYYKKSILKEILNFRPEKMIDETIAAIFPASPFSITRDCGINAVLPKPIEEVVNSTARVPLLFGICEREAVLGFTGPHLKSTMDNFYTSYRQNCRAWGYHITDDEVEEIKEKINSFYLKGNSLETAPTSVKVDIQTDISYSNVYETLIDVISADLPSSVFVYKFKFDGNIHSLKDIVESLLEEPLDGTYHLCDFSYWSNINILRSKTRVPLTPKTRQMVETFTKMISTFARTGNPNYKGLNVNWKPTTPEKPCYLSIDNTLNMVDGKLNGERMEFWESIIRQYKKK